MSSDRVIAGETLGELQRWEFPELGDLQPAVAGTADETAAQAGVDDVQQQFAMLRDLIPALSHPVQVLDEEQVNGIVALAIEVTRLLVKPADRDAARSLVDAMQEILGALPVGSSR